MTRPLSCVILLVLLTVVSCRSNTFGAFKFPQDNVHDMLASLPPWGYINAASAPYNASGDGTTDNTQAIQDALNAAATQGGGIVFLPVGSYYISGSLTVPSSTTLKGVAVAPFRSWGNASVFVGTTLLAVNKAAPFITLQGPDSGVDGLQIFYPDQVASASPTNYPATIQGSCASGCFGDNVFVTNTLLVNSFAGIDFSTYACGRHYISKVYGQPIDIGIIVDQCYDIGRIEQVHFWPFWSSDSGLQQYINNNAFTIVLKRSDWEVVQDVFSWGYHVGISFEASSYGSTNGQFSNINFDNVDVGIDCWATQQPGVQISNLNLANAGGGSQRIGILGHPGSAARLIVSTASFWGEFNNPVLWQNPDLISLSNGNFVSWNAANPAIDIQSGRAMISNCFFEDQIGTGINIGADTDRVIVSANEMVGNKLIIDNPRAVNIGNDL